MPFQAPAPIKANINFLEYKDFSGGYNTADSDTTVQDNELTGGQNIDIEPNGAIAKRSGHTIYGNYVGNTTGGLGLFTHEPPGGTAELLLVFHTGIYRLVSGIWTALTSVTLTTNKKADAAFYPITAKTYVVNQTDSVVKYTSGTSGDQTDASFKKGKYIVHFKNRLLVAGVTSQLDRIWYTDLGVDTFSANNYITADGEVTGLEVISDKLLVFTKHKVFTIPNFTFDGVAAGPESFLPLRGEFGAVYDRTIKNVGNLCYFLGQSTSGIAAVYVTDGLTIGNTPISTKIETDFLTLNATVLSTVSCAGRWGDFYRLSVATGADTTAQTEYLFDTVHQRWLPPYKTDLGIGGFTDYAQFESSGQRDLYAVGATYPYVYKLNQANYDEADLVGGTMRSSTSDTDVAVDANPATRVGQRFIFSDKLVSESITINGAMVRLKKNTGTTTDLVVRIETDTSDEPSGTLAHASATATISAFTSTSYINYEVSFSSFSLTGNTAYWLVVKHATEGSGTSQYYAAADDGTTVSGEYIATYASATWTVDSDKQLLSGVLTQTDIDAFADTKAFETAPIGQVSHLRQTAITVGAEGSYNVQVGVNLGDFAGFNLQDMPVSAGGDLLGTTFVIGTSVLGAVTRNVERLQWNGLRGRTNKYRFRNRFANQPFVIYSFRTKAEIITKIK